MNILYISKLDGRPWAGPTYSIPKQIEAQSKYDNVFWYNIVDEPRPEGINNYAVWKKLSYFHDLTDFPNKKITDLPKPFSTPDLIVVEQGYTYAKEKIRKEIIDGTIPYIVVPRGELTDGAQNKKRLKKIIGNFLLNWPKFIGRAKAIQCLTVEEERNTAKKWNANRIVIPNGTVIPRKMEKNFQHDGIKCVSIGRLEPYQKGLDLLVEACAVVQNELRDNGVTIDLYGSDMENKATMVKKLIVDKNLSDIIFMHDGVFGVDKENVLRQADVFLIPSRFEGQPTAMLEALAYGLPCLATTGSNMRKEVEESNSGWGADNTVDGIVKALKRMMDEKNIFAEKSENAYSLATKYSWDKIAEESHRIYKELLKG